MSNTGQYMACVCTVSLPAMQLPSHLRYYMPCKVVLATQHTHTFVFVLPWCSFRAGFQMFIPTKHLGPTSILTFCGACISEENFVS